MSQQRAGSHALLVGQVAELVGGRLVGDATVSLTRVTTVADAQTGDLALLTDRRYLAGLKDCRASALLVSEALCEKALETVPTRIVCEDAHLALARLLDHWFPEQTPPPGVHPTAIMGTGVRLGEDVTVGPYAVLEEGVDLGDRVVVGPHTCIGAHTTIGEDSRIYPQVVIYPGAQIGCRVILHAGVRVGVDGFGYVLDGGRHRKAARTG